MSYVIDDYADRFVALWYDFRRELHGGSCEPATIDDDSDWELRGPSETLDRLWAAQTTGVECSPHRKEVLERVRSWLRGAERSALEDRMQVERLLERCSREPALCSWLKLEPAAREQVVDQLLRTLAGLSATIRNERPLSDEALWFRVDWQQNGDGRGWWESASAPKPFSLAQAVDDIGQTHGRFESNECAAIARRVLQDLRTGELTLPLLERTTDSTEGATRFREVAPGNEEDAALLLPERANAIDEELVFWQHSPRLARVCEEALIVAAKANVEPCVADWRGVEFPESPEDVLDTSRLSELCALIAKFTPLSASKVGSFLAIPLKVISATAADPSLQRRARSSLACLRGVCIPGYSARK